MKSLIKLVLLTSLVTNVSARIDDPHGILPISDAFLGGQSWDKAFKVGDTAESESEVCQLEDENDWVCEVRGGHIQEVVEKDAHQVVIQNHSDGGTDETVYSRELFKRSRGNILRVLDMSEKVGLSGLVDKRLEGSVISLVDYEFLTKEVLGKRRKVMEIMVLSTHCDDDGACFDLPIVLTLAPNVPLFTQLVNFEIPFETWTFKHSVRKFTRP